MSTGGVSIHVVDVSRGLVAAWMRVEVYQLDPARKLLTSGIVSAKGLVEEPALAKCQPFTIVPIILDRCRPA